MLDVGKVRITGEEGAGDAFDEEESGEEVGYLQGLVLVSSLQGVLEKVSKNISGLAGLDGDEGGVVDEVIHGGSFAFLRGGSSHGNQQLNPSASERVFMLDEIRYVLNELHWFRVDSPPGPQQSLRQRSMT